MKAVVNYFKMIPQNLPGTNEENHDKPWSG